MAKTLTKYIAVLTMVIMLGGVAFAQERAPSVKIILPEPGQHFNNELAEFKFNVENFTFVDYKNNTVLYPGDPSAGHARVWIESTLTGDGEDRAFKVLSPDYHEVGALESGNYRLTIELVRNDGSEFSPRIFDAVSFSVGSKGTSSGRYSIQHTIEPGAEGVTPPRGGPGALGIVLIILIAIVGIFTLTGGLRKRLEAYRFFSFLFGIYDTTFKYTKKALRALLGIILYPIGKLAGKFKSNGDAKK